MTRSLRVGVIMNGVTGRMGRTQHLARSIAAIRADGGVRAGDAVIWPDPVLVGRDESRLRELAAAHGIERYSTDLTACLADLADSVYFDAQTTSRREEAVAAALRAGKHVYCEKPTAGTSAAAMGLASLAAEVGARNGVVQDKLFLPGVQKLQRVLEQGLLGRLLAVRVEFGYWVFADAVGTTQRPSWNYRQQDGGGIVLDMFCHFNYLFENLFGPVRSLACTALTHLPQRLDEQGTPYRATADDGAYAIFQLDDGVVAQVSASWAVRPFRHDLFVVQVDGEAGSATAGLQRCFVQPAATTPRFVWNPDIPLATDPRSSWAEVPELLPPVNGFRHQWELFLRHVALDEPFPWDLASAARGVGLAEVALRASAEQRWLEVPELGTGA